MTPPIAPKRTPAKTPAKAAKAPAKAAKAPASAAAEKPAKTPVKQSPARKSPAKTAAKTPVKQTSPAAVDGTAPPAKTDLSAAEIAAIRRRLATEITEMQSEYDQSMAALDALQQAGTDGAGDDQADAGSKTFDREQELSIAANRFDLLTQMQHAVERIDKGTYGYCEECGQPIPRARLQAFPMATLDVGCKQREERR